MDIPNPGAALQPTHQKPTSPITARTTALIPKKAVLPPGQDQVQKALKKAVTPEAAANTVPPSTQPTTQRLKKASTRLWFPQLPSSTSIKQKCVRTGS